VKREMIQLDFHTVSLVQHQGPLPHGSSITGMLITTQKTPVAVPALGTIIRFSPRFEPGAPLAQRAGRNI